MSRLIREHYVVDAAFMNLLEKKCTVIYGELSRILYWWPLRSACVVGVGRDYELIRCEDEGEITLRMIMTAYEFGGESNSVFILERGTGVVHNILDTPVRELVEGTIVRVCDNASDIRGGGDNDDNDLVSRILRDMELQEMGGLRVGSEEFHPSDAQIAAEMFAQE